MENGGKETWAEHLARIKKEAPLDPQTQAKKSKGQEPHYPSDLPPDGGIIQRPQRGNVTTPIPAGEGETLNGTRVRTNFTRRGRTPLNGLDEYIQATLDNGGHEPDEALRKKAIKYLHGRSAGIIRSAEARLRRQKPPTEH